MSLNTNLFLTGSFTFYISANILFVLLHCKDIITKIFSEKIMKGWVWVYFCSKSPCCTVLFTVHCDSMAEKAFISTTPYKSVEHHTFLTTLFQYSKHFKWYMYLVQKKARIQTLNSCHINVGVVFVHHHKYWPSVLPFSIQPQAFRVYFKRDAFIVCLWR